VSLTDLQKMVADVIRPFRSPDSYVGGGAALNAKWPRLSDDMDIFGDRRSNLYLGVRAELDALREKGFTTEITTNDDWMVEAIVRQFGFETRVQWLNDPETCQRFLPALDDPVLGFRLHQTDVALNKVLCASRRRSAARDAVDLVSIVQRYCPLGPLVWACTAKNEQRSPPTILRDLRSIAFGYSDEEIRTVRMEDGFSSTRDEVRAVLGEAFDRAIEYVEDIVPDGHSGCLFVDEGELPVEATEDMIQRKQATPLRIKDFSAIPKFVTT